MKPNLHQKFPENIMLQLEITLIKLLLVFTSTDVFLRISCFLISQTIF